LKIGVVDLVLHADFRWAEGVIIGDSYFHEDHFVLV
jgi:hypothetical protein